VDIAAAITKLAPTRTDTGFTIPLRSMNKRTQEAFDSLLPVGEKFPKVWTIPYNLACYCAQLGRLDECRDWFTRAMAIDEKTVQRAAIDDPDLKPLSDSMSGTPWKGT
jgi:hypothetical protein